MENFNTLIKIENDTLAQIKQTSHFDIGLFLQNMEQEFTKLGFRTPNGGGQCQQRILIIRLDAIGDFLLLTPTIREIRSNYPSAFITLVVNKRVYQMAEFCPYVNEVIPFDTPFTTSFDNKNVLDVLKVSFSFAKKHFWNKYYDLSFITLSDATHVFMSYISGARERIGVNFSPEKKDIGGIFLNRPILRDYNFVHCVLSNLHVLKASGHKINRNDVEIWYGKEDFYKAKQLLDGFTPDRMKIVVGIGANVPERKYPIEKYLEALKEIIEKGASVIIVGGPSEIADSNFLQENLPSEFVKNLVPLKLNWRVTAAVISQTHLYIGNDTGTAHCAAAAHIPVIVVSRESKDLVNQTNLCDYYAFFPWQTESITLLCEHKLEGCSNTGSCWAGKAHCITQIKPEEIVAAVEEMIYFKKISKIKKAGFNSAFNQNFFNNNNFFKSDYF